MSDTLQFSCSHEILRTKHQSAAVSSHPPAIQLNDYGLYSFATVFRRDSAPALAELNITSLLDLAFVLLVIFIITTTPIVNDLDVDLPSAGKRPKEAKSKVNYVTVESSGKMVFEPRRSRSRGLQEKLVALRLRAENRNGSSSLQNHIRAEYR